MIDFWQYININSWMLVAFFGFFGLFILRNLFKNSVSCYNRRPRLFTPAEANFLNTLKKSVNNNIDIYGKVRLADIFGVKHHNKSKNQAAFNRISQKHFDFVLCDKNNGHRVIVAIELDDKSHLGVMAKKNDEFKNDICQRLDLPLIRVKATKYYNVNKIKQLIIEAIK